jgi:redoxin
MAERYRARGLRVVSVHYWDGHDAAERRAIAEACREHGLTYPTYLDVDDAFSRALGDTAVPRFFVVGRDGIVRDVVKGSLGDPTNARSLEHEVQRALQS